MTRWRTRHRRARRRQLKGNEKFFFHWLIEHIRLDVDVTTGPHKVIRIWMNDSIVYEDGKDITFSPDELWLLARKGKGFRL